MQKSENKITSCQFVKFWMTMIFLQRLNPTVIIRDVPDKLFHRIYPDIKFHRILSKAG